MYLVAYLAIYLFVSACTPMHVELLCSYSTVLAPFATYSYADINVYLF